MISQFIASLFLGCGNDSSKRLPFEKQYQKYVVLDLDETLIHARPSWFQQDNQVVKVRKQEIFVSPRPHLMAFLEEISKYYTIVIYTTGVKDYAEAIIKTFGISKYIKYLLHREHCVEFAEGALTKDLNLLEVPLHSILLIDDSAMNSFLHPKNTLLVKKFIGAADDDVLMKLIPFLSELACFDDIRDVNAKHKSYQANPARFLVSQKVKGITRSLSKERNQRRTVPDGEDVDFTFQVNKKKMAEAKKKLQGYSVIGMDRKKGSLRRES